MRNLLKKLSHDVTAVLAVVLFGLLEIFCAQAHADTGLTTGSLTGTYYKVGRDISKYCSPVMPLVVYESTGSVTNVERVLALPQYQLGITQHDALLFKGLTDPTVKDKIKMVFPLYRETVHLVATTASGIRSLNDFQGKRIIIGAPGSGNWVTAQLYKKKTGLSWTDIELSPDQGITQLLLGQADAMFVVAGAPVKVLTDLGASANGKLRLVPASNAALDAFYIPSSIPDGTYSWVSGNIQGYSVQSILVTFDYKTALRQNQIKALTSCILKNLPTLQESDTAHPVWRQVEPTSYAKVNWPIHSASKQVIDQHITQ